MSDKENLINSEMARSYADALLTMVHATQGEGVPLPDDAVSMMSDLADWVSAVAATGPAFFNAG